MYLSIYSSRFEIFFGESKTAGDFSFIFPHQSVEAKKKTRTPPRHNAHKISGTLGVSVCKILLLCRANDLFLSIWYMYIAAVWNWNKIICNKYISSKRKRKEITFVFSLFRFGGVSTQKALLLLGLSENLYKNRTECEIENSIYMRNAEPSTINLYINRQRFSLCFVSICFYSRSFRATDDALP
jgi:hypothetical protein